MVLEKVFRFLLPETVSSKEEINKIKISDSMYQNVIVLKYLGYWLPPKDSKYFYPYAVYSGMMVFWILLMWNITQFIQFYYIIDDIEQVAHSTYILSCTAVEIIKGYYFIKNTYIMAEVTASLDRDIFKPQNIEQYKLVARILRYSQFTYIFYKGCANLTVFFWATYPVYDTSSERRIPFAAWFPWDYQKTPMYEICYVYQVFGAFCLAWLNITMDTTASGLMSNIAAQLDLLSFKLVHLYEDTETKLRENKKYDNITPEVIYEEMSESLIHCIEHHKNILDLTEGVGSVFAISVFYQFFVSAAILCMTMFQLTLVKVLSFEFFSLIFFQICMFLQVAMYCWFGNEVILKSEKVIQAAFSCDWMDCSQQFKQNLMFFMVRLQMPLKLYAGGFFVLSVETFTLILRSAWSYFAVLRQSHNKH